MANGGNRKNDARIYVVSGLFCIFILSGGFCLTLFITLPESSTSIWYAIAGMILVGIPWVFWLLICMYRCCTYQVPVPVNQRSLSSRRGPNSTSISTLTPTATAEAVGAATTSGGTVTTGSSESPDNSQIGRHVRFGSTTVVGDQDCISCDEIDDSVETESDHSYDVLEGFRKTKPLSSSSLNFEDGSPESEQPLTFNHRDSARLSRTYL